MESCVNNKLNSGSVQWEQNRSVVGIVLASAGYPGSYEKNKKITGLSMLYLNSLATSYDSLQFLGIVPDDDNIFIFHAGTKQTQSGDLVTSGGRVLTIVASSNCLTTAHHIAMKSADRVKFQGSYHRKDIAVRGIAYENRLAGK